MKIVGIDGDVLRYELGAVSVKKEILFGLEMELPWSDEEVFALVDEKISSIKTACGADSVEVFLTGSGNFRVDLATIKPYKGQRKGDKPFHWSTVGRRLQEHWRAVEVCGIEADDILAIRSTEVSTSDSEDVYIIASRDKDLRQVPGLHYSWKCGDKQPEKPLYSVDALGEISFTVDKHKAYHLHGHGLRFFYAQMLVGDSVDNIQGCPRIGPKIAVQTLSTLTTEAELFQAVAAKYVNVFGDNWKAALEENARLLHLIRKKEHLELVDGVFKVKQLWECPYEYSRFE